MNSLEKFQTYLQQKNIDTAFISSPINITYLTGYKGVYPPSVLVGYFFNPDGFLVVPQKGKGKLLVDGRYAGVQFERQDMVDLIVYPTGKQGGFLNFCLEELLQFPSQKVGIEELYLTYSEGAKFVTGLVAQQKEVIDISEVLVSQRAVKTPEEIKKLKKAVAITDKTFSYLLENIKVGMTELEIAEMILSYFKIQGAESAFDPIVASGTGSAMPHYSPTNKKIKKGEVLLLDFGAKYQGYHGDMTRTIFLGKPTDEQVKVYDAVLEAQLAAAKNIKPLMTGEEGFNLANDVLKKYSYDQYFTHSLGHGVGLFIHEDPKVSLKSQQILEEGNVFSIEPGVYLPEKFGVRIEDLVLLTESSRVVLTKSEKDIISL